MTHPTSVGRGRPVARRVLLALTTALVGTLATTTPAFAQQAGMTSGTALATPSYNPLDANGVDLLSGRFTLRSPMLSMDGSDDPTVFFLTWNGQLWMPNTPHLWMDKDRNWRIVVEYNGVSEEFGDAVATGGNIYKYTQKSPNIGSSLTCAFNASVANGSDAWLRSCTYYDGGKRGVNAFFKGNDASSGCYPSDTVHDYEQFGNALVWPVYLQESSRGRIDYPNYGTHFVSDGGALQVSYPNGIYVNKTGFNWSATVTLTMTNQGTGATQIMRVSTPNLSGNDKNKSYLHPKSTTQFFYDPLDRVTSYTFNANGDMTRVVTPGGVISDLTYDGDHEMAP